MKKTTKSLFLSVVSLVLCFAMLLGTTYAWFTDSVTSSGNVIKTGTLDLEMYWSDDLTSGIWNNADGDNAEPVFNYQLWEPGYTAIRYIKIVNAGSQAFKYALNLIPEGDSGILGDVIDVYYVENAQENVTSLENLPKAGVLSDVINKKISAGGVLLPKGEVKQGYYTEEIVVAIVLHMQENAGNEYQDQSIGASFDIQLLATQYDYESDDIGGDYDEGATFPDMNDFDVVIDVPVVNGAVSSDITVQGEGFSITVPAGVMTDSNKLGASVTQKGESDANLTLGENDIMKPLDVHVEGVAEGNTVPIIINLGEVMPKGLNIGNYTLYHVEDGASNEMTSVSSVAELDTHNEFYYDPVTGEVTVAMASFSEVALVADTENAWNGTIATSFAGGEGTAENPYLIANADQLAYLGEVISNENETYGDKHYKLIANINLGGEENTAKGVIFYPIGYTKVGGDIANVDVDDAPEFLYFDDAGEDYAKSSVNAIAGDENSVWYTYGGAFKGVFDGNGNTIKNIYQNTWQMRGNYDGHYYKEAMGIFGYVYGGTVKNLTVDNFTSDGEFTPTGVIAAYAANATFENIAIKNCNPRVYNTGNGGIVGVGGSSSDTADKKLTFTNITVDNSNTISALWGSWDVACGGIMGMFRGNGLVHFENCHIGAQIDVYNDVCGNYQYYWYRYSGMLIGSIRGKNITVNGYTVPDTTGITASNSTVHFGDWNDYYYCELVANTLASYTHDHQFSRLTKISSLDEIKSGDDWTKSGNFLFNGECYHIVNKDGVLTRHLHVDAGYETVNGQTVLKEDKQIVYLPFNQLIQGDGWGVKTIGFRNDSELDFDGITILDREEANSINKFGILVNGNNYEEFTTVTVGDIFKALDDVSINANTLKVFVSPVGEGSTVSAIYTPNTADWTKGTLTFSGYGAAKIVITDYTYCKEAVASVTIDKHEHTYTTAVTDPTCTTVGYTTYTCDCGYSYIDDEVAALGHNYNAVVTDPDCEKGGYTTYTCTVCGYSYVADHVEANGHSYKTEVTAPTCTEAGYTTYTCACGDTYTGNEVEATGHINTTTTTVNATCTVDGSKTVTCACGHVVSKEVIPATGHSYKSAVTAPTCTTVGYTTYTCDCGDTYRGNEVAANGHKYNAIGTTAPTCTADGYTTYKCSACTDFYKADEVAALGHITTNFAGDFLYRVGNQNAVALSSLFNVGKHTVSVSGTNVAGNASVEVNGTSLTFSGTGIVNVTLTNDCTCNECALELTLEVVDAVNATSATDANDKDIVLLNNIGSGFTVDNGHTVYGNGFTLTYTGDGRYLNNGLKQGVVMVQNGGTLDNLRIKASIYPTAFMYYGTTQMGEYVQQSSNPREVDGDKTRYYYQLSAVATYGEATISNCYIYGGRTNIYVNTGNVTIKDSILECGIVANVQIQSTNEYTVTLEGVTTIQHQVNATVGDTSKVMLGAGVLVGPETTSNPNIVLGGEFKQYNWVTEDDADAVSAEAAEMIINGALSATSYNHTVNGKTASNLGIIYMNDVSVEDHQITNNTGLPYKLGNISMTVSGVTVNGQAYSLQNATAEQIYSDYVNADRTTVNGDYLPTFEFDLGDQEISYDGSEDTRYLYGDKNGITALYQDGDDALTLDLTKLATIYKYNGINYTVTAVCKDSSGNTLTATNGVVTLDAQGNYTLEFTVEDNIFYNKNGETISKSVKRTYTVPLTLTVKEANIKNSVVNITKTALDGVYTTVNLTDYKLRINFLDAISVTDYDNKGNGTTVSLSSNIASVSLTPASVNVFTTASTITVTYTDGRVLTVNLSKISGSSPGTKTAVVNTSGGLYFITEGALDNKPTASSNQNKCTITSVSFKGNSGSTVTNDTDVTVTWALGSSSGCFAEGTLITLADGTQKRIEEITFDDQLLAWDFHTGTYVATVPSLIDRYELSQQNVINLKFADGTVVRMVVDHGFFDVAANKFVFLNEENVASYVGHTFVKMGENGTYENVELVGYEITVEDVAYYSIQTAIYNNCIAEGVFTLCAPPEMIKYSDWFDYFEIGEGMKYDEEKMQEDIEKYGLYTYEDFAEYVTYEQFIAFNGPYLKVLVGRGVVTYEQIIELISMYVNPEQ